MTQEKNIRADQREIEEAFTGDYTKKVHIVGRFSIVIVLVLSFLPVLYMHFIKGYQMPIDKYLNVAFAITAFELSLLPFTMVYRYIASFDNIDIRAAAKANMPGASIRSPL